MVRLKGSENTNHEVFEIVMKRLAESWFFNLFTSNLMTSDFLRVLDCVFINGFEFCHKFGLALLSKNEAFFLNSLKQEVKIINITKSSDFLIYAGNVAKNKLVNKFEKVPIETLIKKCLTKPNYTSLSRHNIRITFDDNTEISNRIEKIKGFIKHLGGLEKNSSISIIKSLSSFEDSISITRPVFLNFFYKNFSWDLETAIKFFVVFDQKGVDSINVVNIKLAIAMMVKGFPDKLEAIFSCFDQGDFNFISREDLIQILQKLEENVYYRQIFYLKNCKNQFESVEKLEKHQFISLFNQNEFLVELTKQLYLIDDDTFRFLPSDSKIENEVSFNVFTPNKSPVSGFSDNDVDVDDITPLNLDENIQVIGQKILEVGIVEYKNSEGSVKPAYMKSKEDFESVLVVKDPEYETTGRDVKENRKESEKFVDVKSEKSDKTIEIQKEMQIDSQVDIDQIPDLPKPKQRNGCSRLCTTQPCISF